jgi:hypothetical protein
LDDEITQRPGLLRLAVDQARPVRIHCVQLTDHCFQRSDLTRGIAFRPGLTLFFDAVKRSFLFSKKQLRRAVNTIAVMLLVIIGGTFFWGEPFGLRQTLGAVFGVLSLLLLLSDS